MITEEKKSELWMQAVVNTSNHFYFKKKEYGDFPVTGDMIKCETDRQYARLLMSKGSKQKPE